MTVSPDARTPSASVHALSGSTPPGAGPTMQPFGIATTPAAVAELPDTFAPLGAVADDVVAGLAARHGAAAHPDAEVIDLAGRVVALAEREHALWGRRADLDDAVTKAMPPRPIRREMQRQMASSLTTVDGAQTITVTEPAGWQAEHRAVEAAHAAAVAEHARQEAETGARLGLPLVEKLSHRSSARLGRWGLRLAALEPQTQAGLKAKATASRATSEGGMLLDPWRQQLATSVGRDAIRIIEAEADANEREHRMRDAELFHYGRRWEAANQEHRAAEAAMEASWHRYLAVAPADPEELFVSDQDHPRVRLYAPPRGERGHMWYGDPESLQMLREGYPKELSEERRLGILAAHDCWVKAHADARRAAGCDACEATEEAAAKRESDARRFLLAVPAHTLGGLLLKAGAALAQYDDREYGIEGVRRKFKAAVEHGSALDEAAMAVLPDLATLSAAHPAPAPIPLDFIEFPSGRYPAGLSRDVVETYRAFLELELSYLNHEVYGQHQGSMHYWHDNPAARLHRPGGPEASSRAAAVLGLLGLMPGAAAQQRSARVA